MSKKTNKNELKVILLGESGTGKTSLINVSVGLKFVDGIPSTLASSYVSKRFTKNNEEYSLDIWDTNGQEKYRAMTKLFIKKSKIVVYVYATDSMKSFKELDYWAKAVKDTLGENVILGVAGNKTDLYLKEEVPEKEGQSFADSIGAKFKLVSAKVDPNGFISFLEELLEEYLRQNGIIIIDEKNNFKIKEDKNNKKNKKKSCC